MIKKLLAKTLIACLIITNCSVGITLADEMENLPEQYIENYAGDTENTGEEEEIEYVDPEAQGEDQVEEQNEEPMEEPLEEPVEEPAEELEEEKSEDEQEKPEDEQEELAEAQNEVVDEMPEEETEEPAEEQGEPEAEQEDEQTDEQAEENIESDDDNIANYLPFEIITNEVAIDLANIHNDDIDYYKQINENEPEKITCGEFIELATIEDNECSTLNIEPPELLVTLLVVEEEDSENIENEKDENKNENENLTEENSEDVKSEENIELPLLMTAIPKTTATTQTPTPSEVQEEEEEAVEEEKPALAMTSQLKTPKFGAAPWNRWDKLYVTWLYKNGQASHNDEFNDYQELRSKLLDVKNIEGYEQVIIKGKSKGTIGGNASDLFLNATNIVRIDMSECDFSNVTLTGSMFKGCTSLEELDLTGLDVSAVTAAPSMFYGCTKLKTLKVAGWNTRQISIYQSMFRDCVSLEELDLTGWDTDKNNIGIYCTNMFDGCIKLKTIYASEGFTFDQMESGEGYTTNMFKNCEQLKGGAGTAHIEGFDDRTYARIDNASTGVQGYFSHKCKEADMKDGPSEKSYCNKKGYITKICKVCGHEEKTDLEIDVTAHKYSIINTITTPTCVSAGIAEAYCEYCGFKKPGDLGLIKDPNNHSMVWKNVTTPTCISTGVEQQECEWCGFKDESSRRTCPIDPNNHYDQNWVVVTEPTCTADGERKLDCSACHAATVFEPIEKLGHLPGADLVENPKASCTMEGLRSYTCARCGTLIEGEVVPIQPHTWGAWIIDTEATFEMPGSKHHECTVCHLIENEEIPRKIDFNPEGNDPIGEDEIEVTLNFDPNGAAGGSPYTLIKEVGYVYNVSDCSPDNPSIRFIAQEHFLFNGYELLNSAGVKIKDLEVDGSHKFTTAGVYSLKAKWKEKIVVPPGKGVITYDSNGGSGSMTGATLDIGSNYTVLANGFNAPSGKSFNTWTLYIDEVKSGTKAPGSVITNIQEKSYVLKATWKDGSTPPTPTTKYTITFDSNGGSAVSSQQVEAGHKVSKPDDPTKSGYTFTGWFKAKTGSDKYNFDSTVSSSFTLYAHWSENGGGGGGGTGGGGGGGGGGSGSGSGAATGGGPGEGMLSPTDQLTEYQLAQQQLANNPRTLTQENNRSSGDFKWVQDEITGKWKLQICVNPGMPDPQNITAGFYNGWQYVPMSNGQNAWYYIDPTTNFMRTGWMEVNGKFYYFSELSANLGASLAGWHDVDGKVCYFDRDTATLEVTLTKEQAKAYGIQTEEELLGQSQATINIFNFNIGGNQSQQQQASKQNDVVSL